MRKNWMVTVVTVAVSCLLLTACSSGAMSQPLSTDPEQDILGSWSCDALEFTFTPDKWTFENTDDAISGENNGSPFSDSEGQQILGIWDLNYPFYSVEIRGDRMDLKADSGKEYRCTRQ